MDKQKPFEDFQNPGKRDQAIFIQAEYSSSMVTDDTSGHSLSFPPIVVDEWFEGSETSRNRKRKSVLTGSNDGFDQPNIYNPKRVYKEKFYLGNQGFKNNLLNFNFGAEQISWESLKKEKPQFPTMEKPYPTHLDEDFGSILPKDDEDGKFKLTGFESLIRLWDLDAWKLIENPLH